MNNFDSIDDTKAFSEQQSFIVTKEYRRFAEFCDACLREQYIGLCYGSPGVGKTLSARYYTQWFFLEQRLQPHLPYAPLLPELIDCDKLFYTAPVSGPPRLIRENIRSLRVELGRFNSEFSFPGQQDVPAYAVADRCKLIIVDETERLSLTAIDQLREIYDRGGLGLIFIGMPGLEKKLSRYPQLYSRIGFAHNYRALSKEEMRFLLSHYWAQFGLSLDPNDYTDDEAVATISRITNGNFRLLNRLFRQIQRVMKVNELNCITAEVVEAARECLVIGTV